MGSAATPGTGLAPGCYTAPEFYALEVERIFRREWLCIGRADEAEGPGDYFSVDLLGEPLVAVRDLHGELRVLSRVCRHRSMPVVAGAGRARAFACPYHAWTYGLDGRLLKAPLMDGVAGVDGAGCRLPAIRHEVWEGFLFVTFAPNAAPLAPALEPLRALLANYEPAGMKTVRSVPFEMACRWNWKLMCDNFMETYHHVGTHRTSLEPLMPARLTVVPEVDGPYSVVHMRYRRDGAESSAGYGAPILPVIERLTAEERGRATLVHVFPTGLISLYADHMEFYRVFPEGPAAIHLEKLVCVPRAALGRPSLEAELQRVVDGFLEIRDEDVATCLAVQRGLASAFAAPGRLSAMEAPLGRFARYVERLTGDGRSAAVPAP